MRILVIRARQAVAGEGYLASRCRYDKHLLVRLAVLDAFFREHPKLKLVLPSYLGRIRLSLYNMVHSCRSKQQKHAALSRHLAQKMTCPAVVALRQGARPSI